MDYDKEFQYKEDLVKHAAQRGISTEGTRAEITERLVAQDEINAAAEADTADAQAVSASPEPAAWPAAPAAKPATESPLEGPADKGVMTSESTKAKRTPRQADVADGPAAEELDGKVLLKMTKPAVSHTIGKYRFTRVHPFCLVDKETAERLTESLTGFRKATASEAAAYYEG